MDTLNHKEKRKSFSLTIYPKTHVEIHCTIRDSFFGFKGDADLVIKAPPPFLSSVLENEGDILVCQNIKFNKDQFCSRLYERYFVRLLSATLRELYRFSMFHYLSSALILVPQEEITPLTTLQKH